MKPREIQEAIIKEFKNIGEADKYAHLAKLGRSLPAADSKCRCDENLIKGCQVRTWFRSSFQNGLVYFEVDSMSLTIKGIISLLLRILSGQKPEDIRTANLYFIDKLGLQDDFSPLRANSLFKLINRMKDEAAKYASLAAEGKI